jgi:hypothetical protein
VDGAKPSVNGITPGRRPLNLPERAVHRRGSTTLAQKAVKKTWNQFVTNVAVGLFEEYVGSNTVSLP